MYDIAVVGGGIVGLATARALTRAFPKLRLVVLEKENALARHQSGRNSGVIHAGIYYTPGSLKARLCAEGRDAARAYCDAKSIPYSNVGKMIVAVEPAELPRLDNIFTRGTENRIPRIEILDPAGIRKKEPNCRGLKAIWCPETGIVDWAQVARSYADDLTDAGGTILLGRAVTAMRRHGGGMVIEAGDETIEARHVVTCGGLYSDKLAQMTGSAPEPAIIPFRGDFWMLKPEKRDLFTTNIYPVPDPTLPFLGVHFTPRMDGSRWLGPNAALAFAREGYSFGTFNGHELAEVLKYPGFRKLARRHWRSGAGEFYRDVVKAAMVRSLQRYMPDLQPDDCVPGPAGVRAQAVSRDGALVDDFVIESGDGVLHVRNAPSPAATASLAIGRTVCEEAARRFALGDPLKT